MKVVGYEVFTYVNKNSKEVKGMRVYVQEPIDRKDGLFDGLKVENLFAYYDDEQFAKVRNAYEDEREDVVLMYNKYGNFIGII